MSKTQKIVIALFLVAGLAGAIWWAKKPTGKSGQANLGFDFNFASSLSQAVTEAGNIPQSPAEGDAVNQNTYVNYDYGFSFTHPEDFNVSEIDEDNGGFTVLAEGKASAMFQVFIASFDEGGPITPERIKKDLPSMEINKPQNATLSGEPAIAFLSADTIEVWVAHADNLYQISAPKSFTSELIKILATWRFE